MTSKFIRYKPEFIQSMRPSKDTIISEKLSKHFDWINELFLQSTQYQDNRKKINYNQINSQKWRTIHNNIVNSVLLLLNSLDPTLYDEIETKITNINIKDVNNMRKIVEILHEKACESYNSPTVLNLYIKILSKLIEEGRWYYKIGDKVSEYICPRIVAVSIAQKKYCEMLDTFLIILENFNKTNDEVTYYKIKNQTFIGNILFIAKLYNNHIISIEIINKICKDIFDKLKENSKNCDLIEYLLQMLQCIENYDNLSMVINQLNEIKNILPTRIKFLIMNYIENMSSKKESSKPESKQKQIITKSKETYSNLIVEYIINESITDFMNSLKEKVEGEIVISILRKYSPVCEQKLLKFVEILLEKNIVTKHQLETKFIEYTESGDIDDIADECPVVLKFIEKVKSL
jgi:hypothetical protein